MEDEIIDQRVCELEHRVARIERRLQMKEFLRDAQSHREGVREPVAPVTQPSQPRAPRAAEIFFGCEPRNVTPRVTREPQLKPQPQPMPPPPPKPTASPAPTVMPVLHYQPAPAPLPPPAQTEIEQTIGLRWAGWIGAVVLVIGAGLGIKYAYDQGWFSLLPPALRLAMMSLGSFALIGAGEWVRRKVSDAAAVGLFGAGVATLFLVAYAGHGYLNLYEPQTAFVLMGPSTLIGAAVAMRGRMVSIAVLALIGGNIAPLVLHADALRVAPFCSYLLMLQLVSLTLSWWGGSKRWQTLRGMSLATTTFWTAALLARHLPGSITPVTAFTLIYATLYHAELVLSSLKSARDASGAAFSACVTSLTTLLLLYVTRNDTATARGLWVTTMSAISGLSGALLTLRQRDALRPLAISLRVQSAALLVLAVPIAFSGATVSLAWSALAIAFALLGAKLEIGPIRAAGIVTWILALANLALWAQSSSNASIPILTLFGTTFTIAWATAALMALVGQVVAWAMNRGRDDSDLGERLLASRIVAAAASLVFIIAAIAWLPTLSATVAIVALAWLLTPADRLDGRIGWLEQAAAVLGIATIKWAVIDTISQRLAPGWSSSGALPVLNPLTGTGMLISASLLGLFIARRRTWRAMLSRGEDGVSDRGPLAILITVICAVVTLALTLDIDRVVEVTAVAGRLGGWPMWQVKQMAWTMLWSASALGTPTLAARLLPIQRRASWHNAGAGLTCGLAIKFLVIDTFFWRLLHGVTNATPVANVQTMAAALVVGAQVLATLLIRNDATAQPRWRFAGFLAVLVIAWTGTLEIDRIFETIAITKAGPFADPHLAKQVALSIFWSAFAIVSVMVGFRVRVTGLRYFGLGLFGLTLLKVVLVDLAGASQGYRILSFTGLGLLLLGTSVLYGKLSPKLLQST